MKDLILQMFAGGIISDFWALVVIAGILIAIVAIVSKLFERRIASLTHSVLVTLEDSAVSLGRRTRWLTTQKTLYKLRSRKWARLNEAALSEAQAAVEDAGPGTFETATVAEAVGRWVSEEFGSMDIVSKRNDFLENLTDLLRRVQENNSHRKVPPPPNTSPKKAGSDIGALEVEEQDSSYPTSNVD